jgi:hypothetical protein
MACDAFLTGWEKNAEANTVMSPERAMERALLLRGGALIKRCGQISRELYSPPADFCFFCAGF